MQEGNVEIVRRAIAAWNRHDLTGWWGLAHADVEIDWSRSRAPFRGVYRGRNEIDGFWDVFWSTFEEVRLEIHDFTQVGNNVIVYNTSHMRGRDGIEVIARSALVHTIEGDQITRIRLFQEQAEALEAAGLSE